MVHTFEALGQYLAVDVASGAVHVLDKPAYLVLKAAGETAQRPAQVDGLDAGTVDAIWSELMQLKEQGLLWSEEDYVDPALAVQKNAPIKALCLHVSHDCNLRCEYCFASTGDFGTGRKLMPIDVAKRAIDFVIERSGKRRNIEIDFFGGEPLMAMDTVKATVDYARSKEAEFNKHFRFTITTNGLLLNDENIEYINREMKNCVLSLDGRPEVNDRTRKTVSGDGSYKYIVPKFQKLLESRDKKLDYYVRGTFTRDNLDFSEDVLHMASLGFDRISVEPVISAPGTPYELREEDLPRIYEEYDRLAEELSKRDDFLFFHFMVDLNQGPCIIKRMRGCGAGSEYVAVTPEGDLYPCHQFVGNEDYYLGSVMDGSFNMEIADRFAALNIYTREKCRNCWAKFYCTGGCSASNLLVNGDIAVPHEVGCCMERKRLECAIGLKALAMARAEEHEA